MLQKILVWCGIILGIMVLFPAMFLMIGGVYEPALLESIKAQSLKVGDNQESIDAREEEVIQILAATIPPSSHIEAIKAQAVIVRTYMLRRELGIVQEGEMARMTKEEMETLWQGDFEEIYQVYEEAAYATEGKVMYYEGELIEPVYHKESAGYTRDAMNLYGVDIPYLKAVESSSDTMGSDKVILKTEVASVLESAYPEIMLDTYYIENQMQIIGRDASGYITDLQIGNILLSGEVFRELMGLDSAAFTLESQGDTLVFHTKGIGHGVGLSQNGANKMALEGTGYEAILTYYYPGTQIKL